MLAVTIVLCSGQPRITRAQERSVLPAPHSPSTLDLSSIHAFHHELDRRAVFPLLEDNEAKSARVFDALAAQHRDNPTVSFLREALTLAHRAHRLAGASTPDQQRLQAFAVDLADNAVHKYSLPEGTFIEYDRASWLTADEMWRTIPWGTAFRGNQMLDVYLELRNGMSAEQQARWETMLRKTGQWIHHNPIIGRYVFNSMIELLRLHWRLGQAFDNEEWKRWALQSAHALIRRDVDKQGWITGEGGGVSGLYQLVGAKFLAQFAHESRDPVLVQTTHRIFALHVEFATPTLQWMGNFGTRSNQLAPLPGDYVLIVAAMQNPVAAYLVKRFGKASWSDDTELWRAALAAPERVPVYQKVVTFPEIQSTLVRQEGFQALFVNYAESLWTRGFADLWHAESDTMIFSTLHSLPSEVAKAKLRLGDTDDWAGFPHIRVTRADQHFDSQQELHDLKVTEGNGVSVGWQESLKSRDGQVGGSMTSDYLFKGDTLTMRIRLQNLNGATSLDFHVMKLKNQLYALWAGAEVTEIQAGRLASSGGLFRDRTFSTDDTKQAALQIDRFVYLFNIKNVPPQTKLTLGLAQDAGLHTRNHGGIRLRLSLPPDTRHATLELDFQKVSL
ncbi:MAG: hypothetical protein M3458_06360 [Acidobacteriota bacterium]|nr:hypothetical protein [Acidobacteriota bacterium]